MSEAIDQANRLVIENLPLIGFAVSEHVARTPAHITRDDLASAASLALVQASRSFDPERGVPFARYASRRIQGAILDELRSGDILSRQARSRVRNLVRTRETLTSGMGRTPSLAELAEALGTSIGAVDASLVDANAEPLPLDEPWGEAGTLADNLVEASAGPEDVTLAAEELRYLHAAIDCLPERLAQVVRGLYFEGRTPADLADAFGVSTSRVSQMRNEALALLRDGIAATLDSDVRLPTENQAGRRTQRVAYYASVAARASLTARSTGLRALNAPTSRQTQRPSAPPVSRPHLRVLPGGAAQASLPKAA